MFTNIHTLNLNTNNKVFLEIFRNSFDFSVVIHSNLFAYKSLLNSIYHCDALKSVKVSVKSDGVVRFSVIDYNAILFTWI